MCKLRQIFSYHFQIHKLSPNHLTEDDKRLSERLLPVETVARSALDRDRDDYDNEQQNGQCDREKAALHLPGS